MGWSRQRPADRLDTFWPKVDRRGPDECWEWTAAKYPNGYGVFRDDTRQTYAHRFAYQRLIGPIPAGLVIDHLCRNRACVNPAHLEAVTNRVNVRRGMDHGNPVNRTKTQCPKGHPLSGDNLYVRNDRRHCRACRKAANHERYLHQRALLMTKSSNQS